MAFKEETSQNGFYMTLTSNSSIQYYPKNKAGSFTVHLAENVKLGSTNWEVGLVDIMFPHRWENITPDANSLNYAFTLQLPHVPTIFLRNKLPLNHATYQLKEKSQWQSNTSISMRPVNVQLEGQTYMNSYFFIYRNNLTIPPGCYDSEEILVENLNLIVWQDMANIIDNLNREIPDFKFKTHKVLNKYGRYFKETLQFIYDSKLRRILVESTHNTAKIFFETELTSILGFSSTIEHEDPFLNEIIYTKEKNNNIGGWKARATYPPRIQETAVFVHTDIIQHQYVGDMQAQLLQIVPINMMRHNNFVHFLYNQPQYVPVCLDTFQTIKIDLRTYFGSLFNFEDGNTQIKLHFKPVIKK